MKVQNVLIRCDASIEIGLGHVTRCLVLANQFREQGHHVFFAMKDHKLGIEKVNEQHFSVHVALPSSNYTQWLTQLCQQLNITIFIGDVRDDLPLSAIKKLKKDDILTVAIDEPSDYRKACDLCFYPPHAQLGKLDWQGFEGKIKQGLEYVLLRPEFYQAHTKKNNKKPNILIMMGGTDPYQLSLPILHKLLSLKLNANFILLVSKDYCDLSLIKELESNQNVVIFNHKKEMARFLLGIDFAIISFGMSAYELLAMSIPSIHICLNKDHWQASHYFTNLGIASRLMHTDITKMGKSHLNFRALKFKIEENIIIQEVINATI